MLEINSLLNESFLLQVPGESQTDRFDVATSNSIQGKYLRMIKSMLNLIYEPVLVKNDMKDAIDEVHHLTIVVLLKNPSILSDVWRAFDKSLGPKGRHAQAGSDSLVLNMFKDLLSFPIQNLHHFTYLLKQLCGKNRFQFGRFVFEYCNRLLIDTRDGHNITTKELRGKGGQLQ